ncbi:MAG: Ig-like domain-containing protein, partial [Hominisplanchenecus sp.]
MRTKQISKKLTAYLLCMAMILSCFGICQPSLKVKAAAAEQQTTEVERSERKMKFNDNWKFKLVDKYNIYNDSVQAEGMDYDDSGWDTVELPHDWAIYQEYENSNGVRAAQGALAGGVGWYRKSFTLSDDFKDKTVSIEFDGVYMISQVWVNGHTMDDWKQYLGYVTFTYDITKYLKFNGETNTIAVKVQSGNDSARWYAGAGIYRNVWLISTEKVNVPVNGVSVTTPLEKLSPAVGKYEKIENPTKAGVDIRTEVTNDAEKAARSVSVKSTIYDKSGDICATQTDDITIEAGGTQTVSQTIDVPEPKLWSVDSPNLYWVRTEVAAEGRVVDTVDTRFAIRYIALDPGSGFYLNGVRTQLNGVCEHSDLGALGMEVYQAAIDRRVRKLKSFGCNAVRTAHNPVSPEYIEACDRLGILVFEEAFDQWLHSKNNGDYSHYFNKASDGTTVVFDKNGNDSIEIKREDLVSNAERDIKAMVDRDKNSPAVFSWSTGNEIDDACYGHGMDTLKMLTGWIKEIDTTRPVAACPPTWYGYGAYNQQEQNLAAAEFSGYNYGQGWYDGAHERYPNMTIFGSETASAFYTRGVYTVGGQRDPSEYPLAWNFSSASYSIEMHRDRPYTAGEFVWTGHDYLGEPTPKGWPSKSSYFGIVDTAGFEKDAFYLYRSMWTDMPTVHILPQNWNYKTGDKIPVYIYTNAASVELFLNGKSLGVKNFDKKTASPVYIKWTDGLEYQAGELKAVGWDKANAAGNVIAEDVVYTSGSAQAVELSADRAFIQNDGRDLVFVEATIVDSAGIMVPDADNKITFQVDGGEIVAVNNGDPTDLDPFRGVDYRKAFSGKALVIVKADKGSTNNITVTATADSENGKLSSNTVTVGARTRLPGDGTGTPEFVNAAVTIGKGVSPQEVLPETVEALYSNGLVEKFKVTGWNLDALNINAPGQYQVTGTAEGLEGEFVCTITVKDIKQVKTVNVTTLSRVAPPLPKFVTIEYADGTVGATPVTWDAVPEENYASAGTFTVAGSIGPELTVTANVAVKEVQSVASTSLETTIGTMPQLPTGVAVTFTDGTTEDIGVDWEIDEDDINAAGMVKITGKILGSEVEAEADVNVKYLIYASDLEWTKAVQEAGTPVKDQT